MNLFLTNILRYYASGTVVPSVLSELLPGSNWDGNAASGFGMAPTDPTRTTAKPALRLLVPPGQRFTDTLVVGAAAAANNEGTLIGGVERVRFWFEGEMVDVEPSFYSFPDANGNTVSYWGYWVALKKPADISGEAQLYVTATPADATMQSRTIGPFSFYPSDTLHDYSYTIDTGESVSATNLHTFRAALDKARTDGALNPLIHFVTGISGEVMNTGLPPFSYSPAGGYITVTAEAPVVFGRASLDGTASVDSNSTQRPRVTGLWLKGENITLDFANSDTLFRETGKDFVLDGINLINSNGQSGKYRGGPFWTEQRIGGTPYFLECTITNVESPCISANLVRGGTITGANRDIVANILCGTGFTVTSHRDDVFNGDDNVVTIHYTGAEATATVARVGGADANTTTFTFKWGANSDTFVCGKQATYYAGTAGDGYLISDLVDFVNGDGDYAGIGLADSDAGWSATLITMGDRRASSVAKNNTVGAAFGDTDCKTALTLTSYFDSHGDLYQQRFSGNDENVIVYNATAYDMQTQNLFISENVPAKDYIFFNLALGNPVTGDYFDQDVFRSQFGRSNVATAMSHCVFAHITMSNQLFTFRNDGTPSTFDAYCLIANNSFAELIEAGAATINAVITDNHVHGTQTVLNEAVNTTTGGDETTLYAGFLTGNFTPAGALLSNLKAPIVERDRNGNLRAASDAVGALAI